MSTISEFVMLVPKWHGTEPPASATRSFALAVEEAALVALDVRHPDARGVAQIALRALVDAFLGDRTEHADLFARAHALGKRISETFGCEVEAGDPVYRLQCPIMALHRTVAHSLELAVITECSLCGAGPFECLHVPGMEYDGEVCVARVSKLLPLGGVAWTANPDFVYTWHQAVTWRAADLLARGLVASEDDSIECLHCRECAGEPDSGDLDPIGRWNRLCAERGLVSS